jgi:hypothetical protein
MKLIHQAVLLLAVGCFSCSLCVGQQGSETPLTNASVIKLVRAGFKDKTVIAIIHTRPNRFNLEPDRLIELKRNGVSENIILNMISQNEGIDPNDDGWDDDAFFRSSTGRDRNQGGDQGSTGIFGSGSGSSNRSKGRVGSGSTSGDTMTTGSATVRILRPPSEAGGGQATKLERTPTLNNESIVQLVEAGFSEGTIIKRIENSPADFDLSPAKLGELRKRRVSEAIIQAMTSAMSDDGAPKLNAPGKSGEN